MPQSKFYSTMLVVLLANQKDYELRFNTKRVFAVDTNQPRRLGPRGLSILGPVGISALSTVTAVATVPSAASVCVMFRDRRIRLAIPRITAGSIREMYTGSHIIGSSIPQITSLIVLSIDQKDYEFRFNTERVFAVDANQPRWLGPRISALSYVTAVATEEHSCLSIVALLVMHEPGLHVTVRDTNIQPGLPAIEIVPPVPKREVTPLDRFADQMPQQLRMQSLAVVASIIRWIPDALGDQKSFRQPIRIRLKLIDRP